MVNEERDGRKVLDKDKNKLGCERQRRGREIIDGWLRKGDV